MARTIAGFSSVYFPRLCPWDQSLTHKVRKKKGRRKWKKRRRKRKRRGRGGK